MMSYNFWGCYLGPKWGYNLHESFQEETEMKKIMRMIAAHVAMLAGAVPIGGFMGFFFKLSGLNISPIWIVVPLMLICGALSPKLIAWAEKTD